MTDNNSNGSVKIPMSFIIWVMGIILSGFGFFLKMAFADIADNKILVQRHETIIPIIQTDVAEIKSDIKKILVAVRQ